MALRFERKSWKRVVKLSIFFLSVGSGFWVLGSGFWVLGSGVLRKLVFIHEDLQSFPVSLISCITTFRSEIHSYKDMT